MSRPSLQRTAATATAEFKRWATLKPHFLAVLLAICSAHVLARDLAEYPNLRYGFILSYPADFEMDAPPDNGDGRVFRKAGGCEILAFGSNNVLDESLSSLERVLIKNFDKVTHRVRRSNWVQITGIKGERQLAIRAFVGRMAINQVQVLQPKIGGACRLNAVQIMTRFRPGPLNEAHQEATFP